MANSLDLIREARSNGEVYLATQISLAVAADQRAISLGGILAAAASVLFGLVVAENVGNAASALFVALSAALAVASGLAFMAARPVDMRAPGNVPENWYEDIEKDVPLEDALREDLGVIQRSIDANAKVIGVNGRWLRASMIVAATSILITACSWFVLTAYLLGPSGFSVLLTTPEI